MTAPDGCDLPPELQWLPVLETGMAPIDGDHRRLVEDTNLILSALKRREPVLALARRMRADCAEHFRREEEVLAQERFPGLAEHEREHRRIERELDELVALIDRAGESHAARLPAALRFRALLIDHFLRFDLRYKSHLLDRQGL